MEEMRLLSDEYLTANRFSNRQKQLKILHPQATMHHTHTHTLPGDEVVMQAQAGDGRRVAAKVGQAAVCKKKNKKIKKKERKED